MRQPRAGNRRGAAGGERGLSHDPNHPPLAHPGVAGLIVAFYLPRTADASDRTVAGDSVDAYLAIWPDGGVTVFAGKVDLGTGARAAIRQIVAEELGVSPERIALIEGDTALTPDQGSTGGSTGIMVGGIQIRQAGATARARLLALAAAQLRRKVVIWTQGKERWWSAIATRR